MHGIQNLSTPKAISQSCLKRSSLIVLSTTIIMQGVFVASDVLSAVEILVCFAKAVFANAVVFVRETRCLEICRRLLRLFAEGTVDHIAEARALTQRPISRSKNCMVKAMRQSRFI